MISLSELLGAEVRSRRDGALGHVRDVHVSRTADGSWEVDRLLLRESGLAVRLGLRKSRGANRDDSIGWRDVQRIEDSVLIVP